MSRPGSARRPARMAGPSTRIGWPRSFSRCFRPTGRCRCRGRSHRNYPNSCGIWLWWQTMDPDGALALLAEAELSERLSTDPQVEKLAVLGPFNPDRLGGTGEDGPDRDAAAILSLLC